jgi:hypothetical protein
MMDAWGSEAWARSLWGPLLGRYLDTPQSPPAPIITAKKQGDPCSAQIVKNMVTCSCLNRLELTQDGLIVAVGKDLSLPERYQVAAATNVIVDSPACKTAFTAFSCISDIAQFRCIGGVQVAVPPCLSLCTSFYANCARNLSASSIESTCTALLGILPASTSCSGSTGAVVSVSTAAVARALCQLAAFAIATSTCALTKYATA